MMAEANKPSRRAVVGPVRLSYVVLAEPKPDDHGELKCSLQMLVPKSDEALIKKIRRLIYIAILACPLANGDEAKAKKLMNNPNFKLPLRDAEAEDREGSEYEGMFFANAGTNVKKGKPGVVLKNGTKLVDPDEIRDNVYSGCWGQVSITAFYFDNSGNKGIAFALNNVMKWKDDDRLDGSVDASDEFADLIKEDDDEIDFGDAEPAAKPSGKKPPKPAVDDDWDF